MPPLFSKIYFLLTTLNDFYRIAHHFITAYRGLSSYVTIFVVGIIVLHTLAC